MKLARCLAGFVLLPLLAACDPMAISVVKVRAGRTGAEGSGSADKAETAAAVSRVVRNIAQQQRFLEIPHPERFGNPDLVSAFELLRHAPDGKREGSVIVEVVKEPQAAQVKIRVREWLQFSHTTEGKAVLQSLIAALRTRFGSARVIVENGDPTI